MTIRTATALLLFGAAAIATPAAAAMVDCNGTCYGVFTNAFAASASDFGSDMSLDDKTSASTSASYTVPGDEIYSGPNSASASASLANGAVRASVNAFAGGGEAYAEWLERLTFSLPEGVASVDVPVSWTIEGFNAVQFFKPGADISSNQGIDAFFRIFAFQNGHDSIDFKVAGCSTSSLCDSGFVSETFSGIMTIEADVLYEFGMGIHLTGANVLKDFSNTAFLGFALPEGVTLNSSSGTFLSDPVTVTAVPEPATWAMLLGGFGLIGGMARTRRRHQAALLPA